MARKGGHRSGQPPIKGFRPGKEPAHLKRQRAKAQLPSDASWAQKQAVDALAGRSPQEIQAMVRTWFIGLTAGAVLLAVGGLFLYGWSVIAGVVVHVLAGGLAFLAFRVRGQSKALSDMAKSMR